MPIRRKTGSSLIFEVSDSFPLQDEPLYGESGISLARRSSTRARSYIGRLIVFSRFTWDVLRSWGRVGLIAGLNRSGGTRKSESE